MCSIPHHSQRPEPCQTAGRSTRRDTKHNKTCHVELVDGTFVRLYGVTERYHFEFASTAESLKFYVMEARSLYEIILGLNWLRAVDVDGEFGKGIYQAGHTILKQVGRRLVQLPQEESAGDGAGPEDSDTSSDGSREPETSDELAIEELMAQQGMNDVLSGKPEPMVARHAYVQEDLNKVDVNPSLDEKVQNEVWETLYQFKDCLAASFSDMQSTPLTTFSIELRPGVVPRKCAR